MFILVHSHMIISIKHVILSLEDNFLFESFKNNLIILFVIIVDSSFHVILARNDLNKSIYLSKKLHLKSIINLKINEYYHLNDFEEIYKLALKLFE